MSSAALPSPLPRLFTFAAATSTALLLALGMPGQIGWWPLLFVALVPLLWMIPRLPPMRAACMGMFCGLLYNIALIYWIVIVLGRYGGLPSWISVPGMALLALYMGSYLALFCLLLSCILKSSPSVNSSLGRLILAAPVLWVGLEYLRSVLFSGFPWMDLGYGLYVQPLLIQVADLGGHHLITFCLVLVNAMLAALLYRRGTQRESAAGGLRVVTVAGCLLLICVGGYSVVRFQQVFSALHKWPQAEIGVIQGNIRQDLKWTEANKEQTVETYLALSRKAAAGRDLDLIVWPETALPLYPQQDPLMGRVLDFVRQEQVMLLTGAPYFVVNTQKKVNGKAIDYYNSGLLINASGRLVGRYNKQHLVPYGEYVPLRSYLPFLEPLVVSVGDFTAGVSSEPLSAGTIRAGVLICFESIFPDIARKEVKAGSNLLVNLTNDAWYGRSSAPYQSLAMSVMRAVETRRSLVRAANTGISGFVEPTGTIRTRTNLFVPAALTGPAALVEEQTFFVREGYWFGPLCLAMIVVLLVLFCRRQRTHG